MLPTCSLDFVPVYLRHHEQFLDLGVGIRVFVWGPIKVKGLCDQSQAPTFCNHRKELGPESILSADK
jgi:hypothetical protein